MGREMCSYDDERRGVGWYEWTDGRRRYRAPLCATCAATFVARGVELRPFVLTLRSILDVTNAAGKATA